MTSPKPLPGGRSTAPSSQGVKVSGATPKHIDAQIHFLLRQVGEDSLQLTATLPTPILRAKIALGRERDPYDSTVVSRPPAGDETATLQPVEHLRRARGVHSGSRGKVAKRQRPVARQDPQQAKLSERDPVDDLRVPTP